MHARAYPVTDFAQRQRDVALEHPELAENYAAAHPIALDGAASGGRLTAAMERYDAILTELLGFVAYPRDGRAEPAPSPDRATLHLADDRAALHYRLSGPNLGRAGAWSIRLGEADDPQASDPVALQGPADRAAGAGGVPTSGTLTREQLAAPPEERTAERFTLVVEALEAGNAYLEATTPGGVLRGQVR